MSANLVLGRNFKAHLVWFSDKGVQKNALTPLALRRPFKKALLGRRAPRPPGHNATGINRGFRCLAVIILMRDLARLSNFPLTKFTLKSKILMFFLRHFSLTVSFWYCKNLILLFFLYSVSSVLNDHQGNYCQWNQFHRWSLNHGGSSTLATSLMMISK